MCIRLIYLVYTRIKNTRSRVCRFLHTHTPHSQHAHTRTHIHDRLVRIRRDCPRDARRRIRAVRRLGKARRRDFDARRRIGHFILF